MSQITTHVLDTSRGSPAGGISVSLERPSEAGGWEEIAQGVTGSDGRIGDLLQDDTKLEPGIYRLKFDTGPYFEKHGTSGFYPYVPIVFQIRDNEHYHVPLLLNPYGYSTYRGS